MASLIGCQSKLISEQVLEGDSIKIKVNTRGTFGNNVRQSSSDSNMTLRFDKTGTGSFTNTRTTSPDYFQPGTPFEGFSVEYKPTEGSLTEKRNSNYKFNDIGTGSLTDKSGVSYENLTFDNRVIWERSGTSGSATPFDISHDYMFNDSSSFVLINTKITALDDFEELYFGRFGDPDQGRERSGNGSHSTINTRDSQSSVTAVSTDNQFAITLATNENNSVGAGISGDSSIGLTGIGTFSQWQTKGRYYLAATESSSTGDESIGLGFQFNNVSSGDTQSFYYAYCLGEDVTASRNQCNNVAFTFLNNDDGDATYTISGTTSAGQTLTTSATSADPDGNGTVSSYTWQSSSDGTNWTTISTSSSYTLTSSEEGKYIRVTVAYTDGESFSESVTASSVSIPHVDTGDAAFSISGTTSVGEVLTGSKSTSDPDGDGSFSYQWQSSSDNSTWTNISGATGSSYTVTEEEAGKYVRLVITYTDSKSFSESVIASSVSIGSRLHTEWLQPFAAMQNVGLSSIKKFRDLVLNKAGDCNYYGWIIDNTDFCLYSNVSNSISYVNGNGNYGGYDYANFITSINLEKTFNDKWKAGLAYGFGTSNLDSFNFSGTTANFSSNNRHYSIFASKKVSDKFTLKGMIAGSDFDYVGNRNYSTTVAKSSYDADGYTAEIIGTWDIYKFVKESKSLLHLQPFFGIAFANHKQERFSESGSGDLVTISANEAQSLLLKTGIGISKQIPMEKGKWILVPSIDLNYEYDAYAKNNSRRIDGIVKGSSDATTFVSSKTLGEHRVSAEISADFIFTENFSFNLNADYVLADGGNQYTYGGGFRLVF